MEYNCEGQAVRVGFDVIRMLTILDLHASPVTPSSRKDDYFQSTMDALDQAFRFGSKMGCSCVLLGGDIFHLKTASRNPPWFLRALTLKFKEAKKMGLEVLAIAGNHDLTFGSLSSFENQPIGVLAAGDAIHLLDNASVLFEAPSFKVRVAGASYAHAQASPVRDLKKDGADYLVGVGHFWFGKETGEFFGEPVYGPEYFSESEVDVFVIGHHHADQGIPEVAGRTYFSHGSINRVGAHAGDLERRPAVGLLEITESGVVGKIARLKVPDAKEIFDLDKQREVVEEKKELNEFMNLISNQVVTGVDVGAILGDLSLPAEVRTRVDNYLTVAEAEAGTA